MWAVLLAESLHLCSLLVWRRLVFLCYTSLLSTRLAGKLTRTSLRISMKNLVTKNASNRRIEIRFSFLLYWNMATRFISVEAHTVTSLRPFRSSKYSIRRLDFTNGTLKDNKSAVKKTIRFISLNKLDKRFGHMIVFVLVQTFLCLCGWHKSLYMYLQTSSVLYVVASVSSLFNSHWNCYFNSSNKKCSGREQSCQENSKFQDA